MIDSIAAHLETIKAAYRPTTTTLRLVEALEVAVDAIRNRPQPNPECLPCRGSENKRKADLARIESILGGDDGD